MTSTTSFDFVVVGGGTAGCVIASRLSQAGLSVAVFEAGPEDYSDQVMSPLAAPTLHGSSLEYNYLSEKQATLAEHPIPNFGGRILSGSSGVNYGNWTKGHSVDYDAWALLVGDEQWSYQGLLKYFEKVDTMFYASSGTRLYPLKEPLRKALTQSGLNFNNHANSGNPLGFAALSENWKEGKRQPASKIYDLSRATVFTETIVSRIIVNNQHGARGIELLDGRSFMANKEVIVCCGSIKTPQLLMLSGIGPSDHLSSFDIPIVADLPVGEGLHDHFSATLFWKLKHPEEGLAIGSSLFNEKAPDFKNGNPIDWIVTGSTDSTGTPAQGVESKIVGPGRSIVKQARGNYEFFISYAPIAASAFFDYSLAGSHITTPVLGLLPTSRGAITLASRDPSADPIINPNYVATEEDRAAMRTGVRTALRTMLNTTAGQSIVENETPPPGQPPLSISSTDNEIDERVKAVGRSFYQCAGTAAMGKVVDCQLKVKTIANLRVVDASILPLPLAAHYQYPIYAIAECAADLILGDLQ